MNLTRCNNGHFYDMDKFDSCPHCSGKETGGNNSTVPLTGENEKSSMPSGIDDGGDVTMPIGQMNAEGNMDVTAPIYNPPKPVSPNPVAQPVKVAPPIQPSQNPVGGSGETPTVPQGSSPSSLGSSLQDIIAGARQTTLPQGSDDEEKTVGIYSMGEKEKRIEPVVGWMVCIEGAAFGQSFNMKSGKNFIGRDKSMDISIPGDKSISRQCHAIVLYDPKSKMFLVQPGTSRELFYLNDNVVLGVEAIKRNDVLTIGNTNLMFIPCCSESFCWEDQLEKINQ